MDETPEARPLGPSQEGSDDAMLVLRKMVEWRNPLGYAELQAITGLSAPTLKMTLRGLKDRQRVVALGHGPHARWVLAHLANQAHLAQQHQAGTA